MPISNMFQKPQWVMGLMSGTSADGVDGALLHLDQNGIKELGPTLYRPYAQHMRTRILSSMGKGKTIDPSLEQDITNEHIHLVHDLIRHSSITPVLLGFHGQTLYHTPRQLGQKAETLQIGDAQQLADQTNVPVIAKLRMADVAAGGEGAPLVPIFHQQLLRHVTPTHELATCAIVNIGGVCNVTLFGSNDELIAGDVGPGCCLLDDWMQQQNPAPTYAELSDIAKQGQTNEYLLQKWLDHPFFRQPLPKSADRLQWRNFLEDIVGLPPNDAIATLANLTTKALVDVLPHNVQTLYIAGGGRHHQCIMHQLTTKHQVVAIDELSCSGDFVEAYAFALLAVRSVLGLPISFPGTTGVSAPISGGDLYTPSNG